MAKYLALGALVSLLMGIAVVAFYWIIEQDDRKTDRSRRWSKP